MGDRSRVVWSEGMFLRPQHFQQGERHREHSQHQRALVGEGHFWGFHSLQLDETSLAIGKVAISRAAGVLPDGTTFSFPEQNAPPKAIDIPPPRWWGATPHWPGSLTAVCLPRCT